MAARLQRIGGLDDAAAFLGSRDQRRLGHNTTLVRFSDREVAVIYHHTAVVRFRRSETGTDTVTLDNGGWYTSTTLARLRAYSPYTVYQRDHAWYVEMPGGPVPFVRGMTFVA
jgi:hypothetical protein